MAAHIYEGGDGPRCALSTSSLAGDTAPGRTVECAARFEALAGMQKKMSPENGQCSQGTLAGNTQRNRKEKPMSTIAQTPQVVNGHTVPTTIPQAPALLPEAPCSITMRVPMPGYADHALITGRGQTGAEAAAQWQGSRDAMLAVVTAPAPLLSRTQRLSLFLACGLEKALAAQDTGRVQRLLKAAALVLAGCVSQESDGAYVVRSQTEPEKTVYRVVGHACTCQDATRHADESSFWCKHALSVLFVAKLDLQEQE